MKRLFAIIALTLVASVASAQWTDDLYNTSAKKTKKESKRSGKVEVIESNYNTGSLTSNLSNDELVTSYEDAISRRIMALRNTATVDQAYWDLLQQYQAVLEKKYNQNLYNIVVVGNEMWVEPQAITALFDGSDPAAGVIAYNDDIKARISGEQHKNSVSSEGTYAYDSEDKVNININFSGFGFGFGSSYYSPWHSPYYSSWYSPYYSSWYNPWYSPYYSPYYSPWYRPYYGYGSHYYSGNPRGTYYGNRTHSYHNRGGSSGVGGSRNRGGTSGVGASRGREGAKYSGTGSSRPTGVNTVNGLGSGRTRVNDHSGGRVTRVPVGGVADNNRDGGRTITGVSTNRGGGTSRGSSVSRSDSYTQRSTRNSSTQGSSTQGRSNNYTARPARSQTNSTVSPSRESTRSTPSYSPPPSRSSSSGSGRSSSGGGGRSGGGGGRSR